MMKPEIKNLNERLSRLSGGNISWPSLTLNERQHAEAPSDETDIPPEQLIPYPEEEWLTRHRLAREAEDDKYLESMNLEDIAKAVEVIREWFPGEFTERGERTAVALLLEAIERHSKNPDTSEAEIIGSWVFSCVPDIHKTRKGLIHQYQRAMAAGSISK